MKNEQELAYKGVIYTSAGFLIFFQWVACFTWYFSGIYVIWSSGISPSWARLYNLAYLSLKLHTFNAYLASNTNKKPDECEILIWLSAKTNEGVWNKASYLISSYNIAEEAIPLEENLNLQSPN
jgi:hypothetical protein